MRIISKFKDYYDHANPFFDTDKSRTWERKTQVHDLKPFPYPKSHASVPELIGFCGVIFPFKNLFGDLTIKHPYSESIIRKLKKEFLIYWPKYNQDQYNYSNEDIDFMSIKKYKNIDMFIKKEKKRLITKDRWSKYRYGRAGDKYGFHYMSFADSDFDWIFKEYKTPVFYIINKKIYTDICLSDFSFQSNKDASQTYQQIEMFMINEIWNVEKETPKDDITARDSKGFDKYSFKKQKEHK